LTFFVGKLEFTRKSYSEVLKNGTTFNPLFNSFSPFLTTFT